MYKFDTARDLMELYGWGGLDITDEYTVGRLNGVQGKRHNMLGKVPLGRGIHTVEFFIEDVTQEVGGIYVNEKIIWEKKELKHKTKKLQETL